MGYDVVYCTTLVRCLNDLQRSDSGLCREQRSVSGRQCIYCTAMATRRLNTAADYCVHACVCACVTTSSPQNREFLPSRLEKMQCSRSEDQRRCNYQLRVSREAANDSFSENGGCHHSDRCSPLMPDQPSGTLGPWNIKAVVGVLTHLEPVQILKTFSKT